MSHYSTTVTESRMTYDSFACFSTRVLLNKYSVRAFGSSQLIYVSTNPWTVPAVGSSVTLSVTQPSGSPFPISFQTGDHVTIGIRVAIARSPVSVTTTANYQLIRRGGYEPGVDLSTKTMYMVDPSNNNVTACTTSDSSLNNALIGDSQSFTVTSTAAVPSYNYVVIGDHTGTYVVTSAPSSSTVTLRKIADGDVPTGTVITSQPAIASGKLLCVVPKKPLFLQFVPTNFWYCCVKNDGNTSINTIAVSAGWNPHYIPGHPSYSDCMGWSGGSGTQGIPSNANVTVAGEYGVLLDTSAEAQSLDRIAVPAGHALMCSVTTPASVSAVDYVAQIFVKGYYSEIPMQKDAAPYSPFTP